MNTIFRNFALIALAGGMSTVALAVTTQGSTTIIQPLTVHQDSALVFGKIIRPTDAGSVTLPANSDTLAFTGTGAAAVGTTSSRAKYTVTGEGGQTVGVAVDESFLMSNQTDNTKQLTVTLVSSLGDLNATTDLSGTPATATFSVGGSFPIDQNTISGVYQGTFNVSINYQ